MSKVILYIPTAGKHPTMERICNELSKGFSAIGKNVIKIDLENNSEIQIAYDMMLSGDVEFSVGLNASVANILKSNQKCIYEDLDVPYVSVLLDAPYNTSVGNLGFECRKHFLCLLDKSHLGVAKKLYPHKNFYGEMFLPLGGIAGGNEDEVFSRERPYDVVVSAASFSNGNPVRFWHEDVADKQFVRILDDVADYLLAEPVSVSQGFKYVLNERGFYDEVFMNAMLSYYFKMFRYIKTVRRAMSIELLVKNDICLDIFGDGWDNVPIVRDNIGGSVRLHKGTSYQKALDLMAQAKVVFQDQAEFNNGAHDRVFSAMLSGAVVVSEYSSYLDKEFSNGKDIFMYDWKNGLSQVNIIKELLNDESKRLSAAVSAYGKANERHRWVNRAHSIIEAMAILEK